MTALDDLIRHADNTISLIGKVRGPEKDAAYRRLEKMAADLHAHVVAYTVAVEKGYQALTPERMVKYPERYEELYERWMNDLTTYERVCLAELRAEKALAQRAPVYEQAVM